MWGGNVGFAREGKSVMKFGTGFIIKGLKKSSKRRC